MKPETTDIVSAPGSMNFAYALAETFKLPQLAFTNIAYNPTGGAGLGADITAQLELANALRDAQDANASIADALRHVGPNERAALESMGGKLEAALRSGDAVAMRALAGQANQLVAEAIGDSNRTREDGRDTPEKRWAALKQLDAAIDEDLKKLRDRGLISQTDFDRLKAERARLDAMATDDPARIKGEQSYNVDLSKVEEKARVQAKEKGDAEGLAILDGTPATDGKPEQPGLKEKIEARKKAVAAIDRSPQADQAMTMGESAHEIEPVSPPKSLFAGINGVEFLSTKEIAPPTVISNRGTGQGTDARALG